MNNTTAENNLYNFFKDNRKQFITSFLMDTALSKIQFDITKTITNIDLENENLRIQHKEALLESLYKKNQKFISKYEGGILALCLGAPLLLMVHPLTLIIVVSLFSFILYLIITRSNNVADIRYLKNKINEFSSQFEPLSTQEYIRVQQIKDLNDTCCSYIERNLETGRKLVRGDLWLLEYFCKRKRLSMTASEIKPEMNGLLQEISGYI